VQRYPPLSIKGKKIDPKAIVEVCFMKCLLFIELNLGNSFPILSDYGVTVMVTSLKVSFRVVP
jgi:hypothetical protein